MSIFIKIEAKMMFLEENVNNDSYLSENIIFCVKFDMKWNLEDDLTGFEPIILPWENKF